MFFSVLLPKCTYVYLGNEYEPKENYLDSLITETKKQKENSIKLLKLPNQIKRNNNKTKRKQKENYRHALTTEITENKKENYRKINKKNSIKGRGGVLGASEVVPTVPLIFYRDSIEE